MSKSKGSKSTEHRLDRSREIHGVDFSGASKAGKKIWIADGVLEREMLLIQHCRRAETLPGSGKDRVSCLAALRNFIKEENNGVFGMDFPFGLPKPLVKQKSWQEFVTKFSDFYESPEAFREACFAAAGGMELKRATDVESKTPFCAYNLRLYRQTYFGISKVLSPLVTARQICVLPMQKASAEKSWVLEICPASTLKAKNLYLPYKGRSTQNREARAYLVEEMERAGLLRIENPSLYRTIEEDPDGDALDSLIAALATSRALRNGATLSSGAKNLYKLEGYVYV